MTTGSQLNSISCQVAQLENQIKQETLRLIAEGTRPAVDDPGYQAFFDKLKPWSTSLDLISQRLKLIERSMTHELAFKREQAKGAPKEHRFQARQSLSDRERHLVLIREQANRATAHLFRLYRISLTPTSADIRKGVFQLVDHTMDEYKAFAELERLTVRQSSAAATVAVSAVRHELQAPRPNVSDPLMVLTLMMQLLRILWLEKLRQDNKK